MVDVVCVVAELVVVIDDRKFVADTSFGGPVVVVIDSMDAGCVNAANTLLGANLYDYPI